MSKASLPSFVVSVATLPKSGFRLEVEADEQERQSVAEHAGVEAIHELRADLTLYRWRKDGVRLSGSLAARIEQTCVVSLEPVLQEIDEGLSMLFLPEGSRFARPEEQHNGELVLDPLGEDIPDTFSGGRIDVWQPLLEQFLLAIDPWPRAPGAAREGALGQPASGDERSESPFSVLKQLKSGKSDR